ncbi:MAG TPA: hypothetical protein ENJ45_06595 [Phaeodactylibacter sp.]|nr:hypothetical protein [Phaeodactylibacter sp.]
MNTKLTLNINKEIIRRAKDYAKEHNISLSFLIENYLQKIISDYTSEVAPKGSIVKELSGIIKLDSDFNYQEDHMDYLTKKYK